MQRLELPFFIEPQWFENTPIEHIINLAPCSSTQFHDVLNNEQLNPNDLTCLKISPYWGRILSFS